MGYLRTTIKGIFWVGGVRVSTRLITLLRLAVLARILDSFQFGLFGISTLVLAFLEVLTETGINVFLIQERGEVKEYVNSAWFVSIIRGALIFFVILVSAPFVAQFFNSADSVGILRLISFVPLIRGFINPSIVKYQKDLEFKKEFWLKSSVYFIEVFSSIIIALLTRSAESLVWGLIIGGVFEVVVSFLLIRPTPVLALELEKVKKVMDKGKWVTLAGIFEYLFNHLDDIVVGKLLKVESLGNYQMAYKISTFPLTEITQNVSRVTFPVYVKINEERQRLKKAFFKTAVVTSLVVIPFGLFLFFFARELVVLVLSEKWIEIVPVLRVLAIFGVVKAVSNSSYPLFLSVKRQGFVTVITLVGLLVLSISIIPLVGLYGTVGAALAALVGSVVTIPFVVYFVYFALRK